jgi:uncharacterized membrane protein YfcA
MLAALTLFGLRNTARRIFKLFISPMLTNAAAVATFITAGLVHWRWTIIVAVGAIAGGYAGLHAARRVPAQIVKGFVVAVGIVLTVYFFMKPA